MNVLPRPLVDSYRRHLVRFVTSGGETAITSICTELAAAGGTDELGPARLTDLHQRALAIALEDESGGVTLSKITAERARYFRERVEETLATLEIPELAHA